MFSIMPMLSRNSEQPLYMQLFKYFVREITENRIPAGSKLPSKRRLAGDLNLSQNTIDNAYQQLLAEGYIESRPRKGMFVIYQSPYLLPHERRIPRAADSERQADKKEAVSSEMIDFSHGKVDTEHFPYEKVRKYYHRLLTRDSSELFTNGSFQGSFFLREKIADYLYQSRGVICRAEQIVIGAGTQYLFDQLCRLLSAADKRFAMESPGFHRIYHLLRQHKIRTQGIPLDQNGLSIESLDQSKADIVYVTPSHQFPMGMIMPISRRLALIQWALKKEGRFIIEDDYDGEFRYAGKPVPSLQSLDHDRCVIYLGTFSKSFIPSLRISYMVLPMALIERYKRLFSLQKQTVSHLHQQLLYLFMKNGDWEHHLNKMRTVYKRKQQTLIQAIKKNFKNRAAMIGEKSGLHLILQIDNHMDESGLISSAQQKGVKVYPTSIYYAANTEPDRPKVLLGFGGLSEDDIQTGISRLAAAWL